ncbi:MAG: outer membrane lipoprotein-sorting protein [Candidatus Margulisbacteria bacterium]|nr:outer membrane lipoprotein-sorting protein [Candidatus Margulisiibacteriota bacterium]MBU1617228.1 outer membrane lipoprotein-sorting protein [Candidatus Margulisiibacteriota bacterium]MBU1867189.1 outer membrane lipoprotein-sorting protein [Candidatus Margulisiibacteriota bacterium]
MKKIIALVFTFLLVCPVAFADSTASVDLVVKKVQQNQDRINDMYAETTTLISSNLALPGSEKNEPQKMTQKGKVWTKGKEKSKVEMLSPVKQVTITNGDKMMVVNPETGQKVVQDLKKLREQSGMPGSSQQMDLEKAKQYFDFTVANKGVPGKAIYVISGTPRKENKFLSRMELYIDGERWIATRIMMYGSKGELVSQSDIDYAMISGVWIPKKNVSFVSTPAGRMDVEMDFDNIKVNRGISDSVFKVE